MAAASTVGEASAANTTPVAVSVTVPQTWNQWEVQIKTLSLMN